jgi:hypothetical protein
VHFIVRGKRACGANSGCERRTLAQLRGKRPASGRTSASVGRPFGVARPIIRSSPGPWRRACVVWYRNPAAGDGNWIVSVIETDVERDKSVVRAATLSHLYWSIWGGLERSREAWPPGCVRRRRVISHSPLIPVHDGGTAAKCLASGRAASSWISRPRLRRNGHFLVLL